MTKCVKCKKEFTEKPHVVKRDIGSESTRKRYPTMKVCDGCFNEGYSTDTTTLSNFNEGNNAGLNVLTKIEGSEPVKLLDDIKINVPIQMHVDPADPEKSAVVMNTETGEIISNSAETEKKEIDINKFMNIAKSIEDMGYNGEPDLNNLIDYNKKTKEIIPFTVLEEVMIKDLPNFEITRRCTRCGKWFDVTVSTNRGDMRISTQLCPHCKHNNQIYVRIKRIDDFDKLRENAKLIS